MENSKDEIWCYFDNIEFSDCGYGCRYFKACLATQYNIAIEKLKTRDEGVILVKRFKHTINVNTTFDLPDKDYILLRED